MSKIDKGEMNFDSNQIDKVKMNSIPDHDIAGSESRHHKLGSNVDKAVTLALSDDQLEVSLTKWKKQDKITFYVLICISVILILTFFIILIISRNQTNSSNLNNTDLIVNYIWSRNVPYFNETDNICYRSIAMIRKKYEPYSHPGHLLDSSCDNGYSLGEKDFIYTCILDGKVHIVLSKSQKMEVLLLLILLGNNFVL